MARSIAMLGLLACAGCGGTSGNSVTDMLDTAPNGLLYAYEGVQGTDFEGDQAQVKVVRMVRNPNGSIDLFETNEQVTLAESTVGRFTSVSRASLNGSSGNLTRGADGIARTTINGVNYALVALTVSGNDDGDFSTVLGLSELSPNSPLSEQTVEDLAFFVIGAETDPRDLPLGGSASFEGPMEVFGQFSDPDTPNGSFAWTGTAELIANFGTDRVNGALTGDFDNGVLDPYELTRTFDAPLDGNGFEGTMPGPGSGDFCPAGNVCTDGNRVDGALYGPNADEATGVIVFDERFVTTATGQETVYRGVGGFVAGRDD